MLRALKVLGAFMAGAYVLVLTYLIVRSSIVSVCKTSSSADRVCSVCVCDVCAVCCVCECTDVRA